MSAVLMISVSGVRGIIGETLSPQVAMEFGQAFGTFLKVGRPADETGRPLVVVGRDSRPSGPMISGALVAGLLSVGMDVADVSIATTPSVALMGRYLNSLGSVVITASHNPLQWNGIKFLRSDGIAFPPADAARIKELYFSKDWRLEGIGGIGRYASESRVHAHHVQAVLKLVDAKAIAQHRYKVVLDSVNGAGCIPTPMLAGKLGLELLHINGEATGQFAHTPEPTRENLVALCKHVRQARATVGFAQDPDADRLAVVDENGVYIGEEYTLALATLARLMIKPGPVVTNLSTSRMVDEIAAKFNCPVYRTPVGEANVAGRMAEVQAIIGGEGNGGVIDPRVGPVRDSLIGIALVLELMMRSGRTISQLVAEIPSYAMIKTKFDCRPEQASALMEKVKQRFSDQKLDLQDGVRVDWPDGWVHARPSNTEPIVRIIAEAGEEGRAKELVSAVQALIE